MLERIYDLSIESVADNTKITGKLNVCNDLNLKFNPGFELLVRGLHFVLADFLRGKYDAPDDVYITEIPKLYCRFDASIPNESAVPSMTFTISTGNVSEDWVLNLIKNPAARIDTAKKLSAILNKWIRDLYDTNYERTELQKIKDSIEKSASALIPLTVILSDRDNFSFHLNQVQTDEVINKMINERKDQSDVFGAKRLKFRANCAAIGLDADRYFTF